MPDPALDFAPRIHADASGATLPYQLLTPPGYHPGEAYPLIIFFHGSGERGTDNLAQLAHVARNFAAADFQAAHPCFVIAPQCPPEQKWVDMPWETLSGTRPAQPTEAMRLALDAVKSLCSEFNIDRSRIYAAGLSMGGYAVWDCITRYPDCFAAGVPCCGGGDDTTVDEVVAQVPVWAFHSADDNAVRVERTRQMIAAMRTKGGSPRYTEYADVGHGSWEQAFTDPKLYPWLFEQRLRAPARL